MKISDRFVFRSEVWGGIIQDKNFDRIWAVSKDCWSNLNTNPIRYCNTIMSNQPYRHKGYFIEGDIPLNDLNVSAPVSVSWNLTDCCNSHCLFCCNNSGNTYDLGISTVKALKLIDVLKQCGVMRLIIGGGEPLMRPDIVEILKYTSELGIFSTLATNGILLTRRLLEDINSTNCKLQISLDTINISTYRLLRGVDALPIVLKNLCMAAKLTSVRVVTVVTRHNYRELDKIAEFITENNISQWFIFQMLKSGRAVENEDLLNLDDNNVVISKIHELYKMCPNTDIFTWGDAITDQISVYIESDGQLIIRDYSNGKLKTLTGINSESCLEAWNSVNKILRSNSFINFIQPNRANPENE